MLDNRYPCHNMTLAAMPQADDAVWDKAPAVQLRETQTGEEPFLSTELRLLRDDQARMLYVRFSGQDDEVHSNYRLHDSPIYRQDVMELFIADTNDLTYYKELECTPYDVHFDGTIDKRDGGQVLNMDYDIAGWKTRTHIDNNRLISVWALPYDAFDQEPKAGTHWRFNAFRIDHHSTRGMSLQAWQPTMQPTFHVPSVFGYLDFVG